MNYNKVLIGGRLTRDPDLRFTGSGIAVCDFGIAINQRYERDGERKESTTFVDCTAWRKTAETISKFFQKGKAIFVEGHLKPESWEDQSGTRRTKMKVVVDRFEFVGGKDSGSEESGGRVWSGAEQSSAGRPSGEQDDPPF